MAGSAGAGSHGPRRSTAWSTCRQRTLFTWDELPLDERVVRVVADPTGKHLLLLTHVEGGPAPTLHRWSEGDAQPTRLAEGIDAAVWQLDDA